MAHMRLFEVTLKYFIGTDTKERAEKEMLDGSGVNYTSMELKEVKAGFICLHPIIQKEDENPF